MASASLLKCQTGKLTRTLQACIEAHILSGSHTVFDGWAAYANLTHIRHGIYERSVIVHQQHFVDPNSGDVHTHNFENM